jgi:drug/metabolite transporter (DMT)-like permease
MVVAGITLLNAGDTTAAAGLQDGLLDASTALTLSPGDAAVLFAAVSYSAYTVRLGVYAKRLPALPLSAGKTAVLGAGCVTWALAEAAHTAANAAWGTPVAGAHVSSLWGASGGDAALIGWVCIAFSALVPGSLATWLQAKGQSGVTAPEAQVILALTPLVSVCIAGALLGEHIDGSVAGAGALMLSASFLCIAADAKAQRAAGGG